MKINTVKELGLQIKLRREKLGYTQAYVSEYTGLSISFISEVENGKKQLKLVR